MSNRPLLSVYVSNLELCFHVPIIRAPSLNSKHCFTLLAFTASIDRTKQHKRAVWSEVHIVYNFQDVVGRHYLEIAILRELYSSQFTLAP